MNNSKAEIGIAWATTKPLQPDGKRDKSEEERQRSVTDGGGATTAADDGGAMSGHSRGRMVKDRDYSSKLWVFRCSSTLKYSKMKRQKSTQQKLLRKSKQARLGYRHSKLQMDRRPQPHHGPAAFTNALIASAALLIAAFSLISSMFTHHSSLTILHQVPEGYVGVYWKGGAILENITGPGFHWKLPLVTHYEPIQVTLQTDQVRDIPCGTKGGVMINFTRIEVVNRLRKDYVYETLLNYGVHYDNTWIYDKIHHEINQFCSSHTLQQMYIDMFDQL